MAESSVKVVFLGDSSDLRKDLKKLDAASESASTKATAIGTAIGASFALAAPQILAAGGALISSAKELDILSKKVDTVFGSEAADVRKWADQVNESMGLSDERVAGLTANLGDLLVPLGFTREAAAKMSKETVGLAGALSAWSGGTKSAAEVTEILQKAMLGERDGLKALGISISEADVSARLLANGQNKLTGEALAQAKAVATQQLIMEKSTDAQKAWSDGTMDATKAQNANKAAVEDAKVAIGEKLLAAYVAVQTFIATVVIPTIREISEWVSEHKELVLAAAVGIAAALVPAFIAWAASATAAAAATLAAAAPVIAIGVAVAALAAGVIWAYQNVDWFRAAVDKVAEAIVWFWEKLTAFAGWLSNDFVGKLELVGRIMVAALTGGMSEVALFIWRKRDEIVGFFQELPGKIAAAITDLFMFVTTPHRMMVEFVAERVSEVVGFFTGLPDRILEALKDFGSLLVDMGKKLVEGLVKGIKSAPGAIKDALGSLIPGGGLIGKAGSLLGFADGGRVPGREGAPVPILAHGGEVVLNRGQQAQIKAMLAGAGGGTQVIQLVVDGRVLAEAVRKQGMALA